MQIDGDVLEIDIESTLDEISEFAAFIRDRLDYIEAIKVNGHYERFVSSSLFSVLIGIKKSKPALRIQFIESPVSMDGYGLAHWKFL